MVCFDRADGQVRGSLQLVHGGEAGPATDRQSDAARACSGVGGPAVEVSTCKQSGAGAHMGPAGRVCVSLALSLAMLIGGVFVERLETYRLIGRGLIGGGWAALYTTVYAMQALEAAKVIHNDVLGGSLLLAVAVGMIGH